MPAPSAPGRPSQYLQLCPQPGKEEQQERSSSIPSSHKDALRQLQFLLNELGENSPKKFTDKAGGGAGLESKTNSTV